MNTSTKKVLMVYPRTGGLDVYVNGILNHIKTHQFKVDSFSSGIKLFSPNDRTWISSSLLEQKLKEEIINLNWSQYDLIVYHYGKNDVEQYIPVLLRKLGIKVKKELYLVHYLSWNLFEDYVVDEKKFQEVNAITMDMPNLMFYGEFPQKFWFKNYKLPKSYIINFYPEAHSYETTTAKEQESFEKLIKYKDSNLPLIIWPGFASNFKNYQLLFDCLYHLSQPIKVVFMGQGWKKRLKGYPTQINESEILVIERYLNPKEFSLAIQYSLFGILLYQQPEGDKEFFQGSGTLPNFIYQGKSTIVLNQGCLPEYVGESGIVLKRNDPKELAIAIETLLDESERRKRESVAQAKRPMFSMDVHTATLEGYIRHLLK